MDKKEINDVTAVGEIASAIRYAANVLGTNNAATPMGAIELLAMEAKEGSERIASSLDSIATALDRIADVLSESRER